MNLGSTASGGPNQEPPTSNGKWRVRLNKATLGAAGDRLLISFAPDAGPAGFILERPPAPGLPVPFPSGERQIEVVVTGEDRGLWRFAGALDRALLQELGIGPRYFSPRQQQQIIRIAHLAYPLLDFGNGQQERFSFELDFANPYNSEGPDGTRSRLRLPDTELPTTLHAVHGHRLYLKATRGAGALSTLALTRAPTTFAASPAGPKLRSLDHHLAPIGLFELHADGAKNRPVRLALGASNLESIAIRPGADGDHLDFSPGPALLVSEPRSELHATAPHGAALTDGGGYCRTSWLGIATAEALSADSRLSLDPEGMQGYAPDGAAMRFMPSRLPLPDGAVPWVPVLGLGERPEHGKPELDAERHFLSRERRARIVTSARAAFQSTAPSTATLGPILRTPQGYAAQREEAGRLANVTFGRTRPRETGGAAVPRWDFALVPKDGTAGAEILAELMATNRLFAVTRLSTLTRFFKAGPLNRIYMADWRAGWIRDNETYDTDPFLILKHDNRSVRELIEDESQWTNGSGPLQLSAADRTIVKALIKSTLEQESPLYDPIKRRIGDPSWSGLLLLKLELSEMPAQLGALETLLDRKLEVHHVGIDLSAIEADAGDAWKTAVFGLVDYTKPVNAPFKPEADNQTKLQLRLNELKLLVDNDAIRSFTCKVETNVAKFLATPVERPVKNLILLGRYESRLTENGERRDSYSFGAEEVVSYKFDQDSFLKSFEMNRVVLLTEIAGGEKRGKLMIDGSIAFNELPGGLDVLGIDHLDFFDLGVGFRLEGARFVLDIDYPKLRFDFDGFNRRSGKNKPRTGSFLSKLPIKLRGFRFGTFDLSQIGYFDFSGVKGIDLVPRFDMAFDFDVDLGSLGALGKKLERFKLNFLIGWSPEKPVAGKLPKLSFGFRIDAGEGAGGIDFGIEGIIRLSAERFRLTTAKAEDGRDLVLLAASKAKLKIFSVDIPSNDTELTFYLFAPMSAGSAPGEKLGWYARLIDKKPEPPVAISSLALGQRVLLSLGDVKSTRQTMAWLDKQQTFNTDEEFVRFAGKPDSTLRYAPNREWFVAMAGQFLELAEVQLLLRDPDLYGVYFAVLGQDSLSVDLVYQKLADGVGRYAAEIMLPAELRNMDFGAVALTLGAIRVEVYTDGGFLIDLGFPEHVDYSRSFVVQGGPFIGKGGFYIARVPREALPSIPNYKIGKAFRVGWALRIGLGREVEKGPMRASLSVSVYGRLEGVIARKAPDNALLTDGAEIVPADAAARGYYIWIQGEVGIILEIEGRVDLKLIQARLLVRAWIGAGVTFESGQPIVLHGIMGIRISLEVVIGKIKIFGKKIKITVRVGYSTELRYEWVLPARFPETFAALSPPQMKSGWDFPKLPELQLAPTPFALKLLLDITRKEGKQPSAILVPSAFLFDDGAEDGQAPLRAIGEAFVNWAVRQLGWDPATAYLCRAQEPGMEQDLPVDLLRAKLADLESVPTAQLEGLLAQLFPDATVDIAFGDPPDTVALDAADDEPERTATAFAFPIPPGLRLRIGTATYDFSQLGKATDREVADIADAIARQFAQQSGKRDKAAAFNDTPRPMVDHLFRNWCELYALTVLDTLQNSWSIDNNRVELSELLNGFDWRTAAARAGRTFHGGLRVATPTGSVALLDKAGLFLPVPAADAEIAIAGIASNWLTALDSVLMLEAGNAAKIAGADPAIPATVTRPSAQHVQPRSFLQLPHLRLTAFGSSDELALVSEFSEDFRSQLHHILSPTVPPLDHKARAMNTASGTPVQEEALSAAPANAMVFDMAVELVQRGRGAGDGPGDPIEDCLQIAGASEAERRPLDALMASGIAAAGKLLRGARAYLAIRKSASDDEMECVEAWQPGVQLARSTVSVERRPLEFFAPPGADEADDDSVFIAQGSELPSFLALMQRAGIVNSGGTYLLLPPGSPLYRKVKEDPAARLSVIVAFDAAAALPVRSVNALFVTNADDRRTLAGAGGQPRRLATRARPGASASEQFSLFETVSLREPGCALLRVWRKKPKRETPSDTSTPAEYRAHLETLFDMLEFGVEVDGEVLLEMEKSVPLASEDAISVETATASQKEDVLATLPAGMIADDLLRYDLLVPIWSLRNTPGSDNPYSVIDGRTYRVKLGWRDLYGNRLDKVAHEERVRILYQDPILPVQAWPGIRAWACIGASPGTLRATFAPIGLGGNDEQELADRRRCIRSVIHQLSGPGVTVSLRSKLGRIGAVANLKAKLVAHLEALQSGAAAPGPLTFDFPVEIDLRKAHSEIDLGLVVEREAALCDAGAPPDVLAVASPLPLRHRDATAETDEKEASESFKIAAQFRGAFPKYWAALGTTDVGTNSWWAVDERLIPAPGQQAPIMYSQPPLARAPMSVAEVPYPAMDPHGVVVASRADGFDLDPDLLMAKFLERIDQFLAPPLAARTSRVAARAGGEAPFARIMAAKRAMLSGRGDTQLLRWMRPVFAGTADKHGAAARRAMREALSSQLTRFHEVASVVVQPLAFAADVPDSWFTTGAEDEAAPKIYGRLRFGDAAAGGDPKLNSIRVLSHGIPIRGRDTELAFVVLPPVDKAQGTTGPSEIDLTDQVSFQVTHVERKVGADVLQGALTPLGPQPAAPPAPSRWLNIIPIQGAAEPLPVIGVSRAKRIVAPAPLRRLPKPPELKNPLLGPASATPPPAAYPDAIRNVRQWGYKFTLAGLDAAQDDACCRLIYNAGVGDSPMPAVQTPAEPLFPDLLSPLLAFNSAIAGLWPQIEGAAGATPPLHFETACHIFANLAEAVVSALSVQARLLSTGVVKEDRFILSFNAAACVATVRFVDHLPQTGSSGLRGLEIPLKPHAGDGKPIISLSRGAWSARNAVDANYRVDFSFTNPEEGPWTIGIDPLDAMRLQSIWAAASIRRNAVIDKQTVDPMFVYRTAEIFLQEALVPNLRAAQPIPLGTRPPETLAQRLEAALTPLFAGVEGNVSVQFRLGVESVRLSAATSLSASSGGSEQDGGFIAEPDPKLQFVQHLKEGDAATVASALAARVLAMVSDEPLGRSEDVRMVLSVVTRTSNSQPLLEILRILIPMHGIKDFEP
ncbi:MAG TPA: hypothetical protein VGC35_00290 [Allosphingosinicella sp.]